MTVDCFASLAMTQEHVIAANNVRAWQATVMNAQHVWLPRVLRTLVMTQRFADTQHDK